MPEAICDTSPIQYLHPVGLLHLLPQFYTRIVVPPAVVDELDQGRTIGIDLPDVRALPWMKIQAPKGLEKVPTATDLGAGEKEVLALGMQVPGSVVILDERLGRSYASALKLRFTGTLGILLSATVEGRIPRIEPVIEHLNRLGFRLTAETHAARSSSQKGWRMSLPTFSSADRFSVPTDFMDHRSFVYHPPTIPSASSIEHQCGHFFNVAPWE
ncbi:MAG: DUF3368 domain-containing protein [Acidobacteria bacterium]|nr:MAG: DUF3368 domain-containing protein [Acidobacteriota bacterium]